MMRKIMAMLLMALLWCSGGAAALADGMILPLAEILNAEYVAVRTHHVTVTIDDGHAVTRVQQEFYNPHDYPVEGRYLFPVPPDAILSRFQAVVDGREQQVTHQDADATNTALQARVVGLGDPSLLQYTDWESLAFDLNLPAGGSRQMSLEYEEVLAPAGGLYRYRYVLSTERYSLLPLEAASVTVDLRLSSGLASVYSSSHAVEIERQGADRARVRWAEQGTNPSQDFELFFAPAEGGYGGGLLTGTREGADGEPIEHFLFLFSPEAEPRQVSALPKDLVLVVDRSGSMSGEKMEQARNALNFILGQLGDQDRFSIVSFADRVTPLGETLATADHGSLEEARRYVGELWADGSTDLEAALQAGLEILDRSEARGATRLVVFLTDGLPTAGVTDPALISRLVTEANRRLEARLHVFGVGYDVNTHLLDRLAADNGGSVTYVQPGENLELALTDFYDKIAYPLLTGVTLEFEGMEVEALYPETLPDLFQGSSLMVAGRYRAKGEQVVARLRGWAGDERREYEYHLDLRETGDRDFVPRLWATRRVGDLLDRVRVEGESRALVDEIRELGLSYGIVTPYTSFVIDGQTEGAASTENMNLYDSEAVNQASGETTIRARVQNQMYQQAAQASLASGANVQNYGRRSLAQVGVQQVDLSLLQDHQDPGAAITGEWIEGNIKVDRTVDFGSEEYFALAANPEVRPYLQSGRNVVFAYEGQVIAVRDPEGLQLEPAKEEVQADPPPAVKGSGGQGQRLESSVPGTVPDAVAGAVGWLELAVASIPYLMGAMVLGMMAVVTFALGVVRLRASRE